MTNNEAPQFYDRAAGKLCQETVLGDKWLTNQYFRIGASSLANALFQSYTGKTDVKPF